jgi:ribosomal protein S18 acetylase RimI-like enzyme
LPALHALVESAYRGDSARAGWSHEADWLSGPRTSEAYLAEVLTSPRTCLLVAEADGALIGTVTITDLGERRAYLGMLGVSPLAQATGLGRKLLTAAEADAKARFGTRWMEMTVIALRRELVAWYERRGYRLTGERRPFPEAVPGRDELEMVVLERQLD